MNPNRKIKIKQMKKPFPFGVSLLFLTLFFYQCATPEDHASDGSLQNILEDVESLPGRQEYLDSPFATAGDRVYLVGHQNGAFPDLGWHITGEMGGIWDHPIKLMDGFMAAIYSEKETYCLDNADDFINYPFANKHIFRSTVPGMQVDRIQFVPDGKEAVVVEYTLMNTGSKDQKISFEFTGYSDLRPTWLGERTDMNDGPDRAQWNEAAQRWEVKDSGNEWHVLFGTTMADSAYANVSSACAYSTKGTGTAASIVMHVEVPAQGQTVIPMIIAGSYQSVQQADKTYQEVQANAADLLSAKKERYQKIAEQSRLTIPDKELQRAFHWVKYNTDWLVRDVPEIGRGLAAGLPDYPWWFGVDNEYTLQGALTIGRTDLVYSTVELLHQLSQKTNGNGRIIHEVSTNGAVFNPGNINETPQFASLIYAVYQWTGDRAFLEKYYPTIKDGLQWLLKENDADGNLLADGFGMMEIHGLNSEMIDVAAYSQKAFADAAEMAEVMNEPEVAQKYREMADQLKEKINTDFWVPEFNSYADFIGTTEQALHLIDDAIVRADTLNKPWAVQELKATRAKVASNPPDLKQGFVVHHNWVVNTPMEMGIADTAKALRALETGSQFVNPFGVFVTGIDRDETAGTDEGSFAATKKIFSYTGAVMTLPTGVQAISENNYGRPDQALDYLQRMTRSFGYALPGSIYEVSPDFGMMTQAWNLYSYGIPIVTQFFGIRPQAPQKRIHIQPLMPMDWPEASLENVQIGDNVINMHYRKSETGLELHLQQSHNWAFEIALPAGKYQNWEINGRSEKPKKMGNFDVYEVDQKEVEVRVE